MKDAERAYFEQFSGIDEEEITTDEETQPNETDFVRWQVEQE